MNARHIAAATPKGHLGAGWALADPQPASYDAPVPLPGYQLLGEVTIGRGSSAVGHTLGDSQWPQGWPFGEVSEERRPFTNGCYITATTLGATDRAHLLFAQHLSIVYARPHPPVLASIDLPICRTTVYVLLATGRLWDWLQHRFSYGGRGR